MKKTAWFIGMVLLFSLAVSQASARYVDGTYSASSKGFGGMVTVEMTIADGCITAVKAEGPNETRGIGSRALEQLPGKMMSVNGTENVDTVAGATITSRAVLKAAAQCLALAALGSTSTPTPAVTATPTPTPTPPPAVAHSEYKDGTYRAQTNGFGGAVSIQLTILNGWIVETVAEGPNETRGIGSRALEQLPGKIMAANGTENVDTVAGATITSRAVLEAAEQCLALAALGGTSTPTPAVTATPTPTPTPPPAVAHPEYKDGIYRAQTNGFGGAVSVQLTILNGWIVETVAEGPNETRGIGGRALEQLPGKIMAANGTENVDTVAGATITSRAVLKAAAQCIEQSEDPSVPAAEEIVYIPVNVYQIEEESFSNTSAEMIIISSACTQVEKRAFAGNSALRWIWIPSNVEQIADEAFSGCNSLRICTVQNSAAHLYAEEHSIEYRLLPE